MTKTVREVGVQAVSRKGMAGVRAGGKSLPICDAVFYYKKPIESGLVTPHIWRLEIQESIIFSLA